MEKSSILKLYNLILIRYNGEIWLKSEKVRARMLRVLMENIKMALVRAGVKFNKYHLSKDSTRIFYFFNTQDIPAALQVLRKVFGIYSMSPALRTTSNLKNITERAIEVGTEIFQKNDSFALRVKRGGKHDFTSQDIAVKVGQAVKDHFLELNITVNLTHPSKVIYIEARDEFAYVFSDEIYTEWDGMPIEGDKKIIAMDIGRLEDLLGAFLLTRRGAEIYPILFQLTENEESMQVRFSNWKEVVEYTPNINFTLRTVNLVKIIEKTLEYLPDKRYICVMCRLVRFEIISIILKKLGFEKFDRIRAIADGVTLNEATLCTDAVDLEAIALNYLFSELPIFTPVIGFDPDEIKDLLLKISRNLKPYDYCKFKPENQDSNIDDIKKIYDSLNLYDLIKESLKNIKEINLLK